IRAVFSKIGLIICVLSTSLVAGHGCSTESKASAEAPKTAAVETAPSSAEPFGGGATIDIKPNSPADTVKAFYGHLREKRFREALFLTNLRPAIEGLTDSELKEFEVDFESIAKYVPAQIKINGEIV